MRISSPQLDQPLLFPASRTQHLGPRRSLSLPRCPGDLILINRESYSTEDCIFQNTAHSRLLSASLLPSTPNTSHGIEIKNKQKQTNTNEMSHLHLPGAETGRGRGAREAAARERSFRSCGSGRGGAGPGRSRGLVALPTSKV